MGNSFNLVQEMTKIYRLMQESQVPGLKRLDALNQALHQLSIQMISNPDKAIDEFNRYGGNKVNKCITMSFTKNFRTGK